MLLLHHSTCHSICRNTQTPNRRSNSWLIANPPLIHLTTVQSCVGLIKVTYDLYSYLWLSQHHGHTITIHALGNQLIFMTGCIILRSHDLDLLLFFADSQQKRPSGKLDLFNNHVICFMANIICHQVRSNSTYDRSSDPNCGHKLRTTHGVFCFLFLLKLSHVLLSTWSPKVERQ